MTATRNYGWVTNAFLKANSLWADYIIIADQHSTDGTREMALEYPNVILLDNDNLTYSESTWSQLVIDRARQIEGDKILFFLDIDEMFSSNYLLTQDWQNILKSKPGEVFFFNWANICSDTKHYWTSKNDDGSLFFLARMFHDDGITPYNNEGIDIHTHCIPYPEDDVNRIFYVNDFKLLHFGSYNEKWNLSKQRYFQLVDFDQNNRNITSLSRMYNSVEVEREMNVLPDEWIYSRNMHGFDLFKEVYNTESTIFDQYIVNFVKNNGIDRYKKLDIWDKSFLKCCNLSDPRPLWIKIIHLYFHSTSKCSSSFFVRGIDKILKKVNI